MERSLELVCSIRTWVHASLNMRPCLLLVIFQHCKTWKFELIGWDVRLQTKCILNNFNLPFTMDIKSIPETVNKSYSSAFEALNHVEICHQYLPVPRWLGVPEIFLFGISKICKNLLIWIFCQKLLKPTFSNFQDYLKLNFELKISIVMWTNL